MSFESLLEPLCSVAREAGSAILKIYATDFDVRHKADRSPVTDADLQAERIIVAALSELTPEIPIVSEEAASESETPSIGDLFWLVDPLDGTREFVRRSGDQIDLGVHRFVQSRVQMDLTETQRPRQGRPQEARR